MNWKKKMLVLVAVITLGAVGAAQAILITSAFGDYTTATDNDNQAGPVRGVSYTILNTGTYTAPISVTQGASGGGANSYTATHALTASDPTAPQVEMQNLQWQRTSGTTGVGILASNNVYVAIFDGFTVDSAGAVTAVGTLKGISTTTVSAPTANANMSWDFNNIVLNVGTAYQFIPTLTTSPTLADFQTGGVNAGGVALELKTTTGLLGGTSVVAGNEVSYTNRDAFEPVFGMTYNTIPEPATFGLMLAFAAAAVIRRRRIG